MTLAGLISLLLIGGLAVAGAAIANLHPELPWVVGTRTGIPQVQRSLATSAEGLVTTLGRIPAATVVFATGIGAVMLVCWPVGVLARISEPVDDAILKWYQSHQSPGLTSVMNVLTQMGNRPIIKPVTLIAIVILVLVRRRRRWVGPLIMLAAFVTEFYFQNILEHAVHRSDPPTAGGNYPSGGCARLVLTYGLLIWFLLRERKSRSQVAVVGFGTLLLSAATLEAYSRVYLLKHWASDTIGGLIFGGLLLITFTSTAWVLDRPGRLFGPDGSLDAAGRDDELLSLT